MTAMLTDPPTAPVLLAESMSRLASLPSTPAAAAGAQTGSAAAAARAARRCWGPGPLNLSFPSPSPLFPCSPTPSHMPGRTVCVWRVHLVEDALCQRHQRLVVPRQIGVHPLCGRGLESIGSKYVRPAKWCQGVLGSPMAIHRAGAPWQPATSRGWTGVVAREVPCTRVTRHAPLHTPARPCTHARAHVRAPW